MISLQGGLTSGCFYDGYHCTLVASHGTSQRQSGGDDGDFFLMELGQKERTNTYEECVLLDSLQKVFFNYTVLFKWIQLL